MRILRRCVRDGNLARASAHTGIGASGTAPYSLALAGRWVGKTGRWRLRLVMWGAGRYENQLFLAFLPFCLPFDFDFDLGSGLGAAAGSGLDWALASGCG